MSVKPALGWLALALFLVMTVMQNERSSASRPAPPRSAKAMAQIDDVSSTDNTSSGRRAAPDPSRHH